MQRQLTHPDGLLERLLRAQGRPMTLHVEFEGGPADGTVQDYPQLSAPLPSLYWSSTTDENASIYRRSGDQPDPATGRWRYRFTRHDTSN